MSQPNLAPTLLSIYRARFQDSELKADPAQERALTLLQGLLDKLNETESEKESDGAFTKFIHRLTGSADTQRPINLYIYGKVGRGKSMLMDLFIDQVQIPNKRRVHFHQFMLEIHARLNELRQGGDNPDIMGSLAKDLASETTLLCFDEFHVSNIADAMILGRLFEGLFNAGVTIVTTSNWAPDDLYKDGLQRDRFLPFIDLIKRKMTVYEMDGKIDYRFEQLRHLKSYFSPLGLETTRTLQGIFLDLTHEADPEPMTLHVEGRELKLSRTAKGIGFFNFDELCQRALGAADYLAIANCLHTVILDGVPKLRAEQRDEAIRFMTLIDTLYEAKVKLFMASASPIEKLTTADDIAVALQRTISRLMEMQGEAYRVKPHMAA